MFLTPDELHDLTGRRRPSAQIRWLRDHCWTFAERADGRPAVSRREAERQLETSSSRRAPPAAEPDFTVLDKAG
jgi:hypothetical protein